MKRSMEEKVKRLRELIDFETDIIPKGWIEQAEEKGEGFLSHYEGQQRMPNYYKIVQATWDVHTGVAFSPLYRML